nr:hypothetical protein [Tanacetum cinerariifolium]
MKGWKKRFFFLDRRAIPDAMAWRHHDFDEGLATAWDFPGFCPIFKDTKGNVVAMFEYLRFPFLAGDSIAKGVALTNQDRVAQHTTLPLLENQTMPDKTDHQKEVKVEDPKIVATHETKARAIANKRENKKRGREESEGSRVAATTELQEDRSLHIPPYDSANHSIHNYTGGHDGIEETNSKKAGKLQGPDELINQEISLDLKHG